MASLHVMHHRHQASKEKTTNSICVHLNTQHSSRAIPPSFYTPQIIKQHGQHIYNNVVTTLKMK
jgi:hypothetical protein